MASNEFRAILAMSLIKQLWISTCLIMLLAFGTSFLIATVSVKRYLESQLQSTNIDSATSLALSISHLNKDSVTINLLIAAEFDSGHYRLIRLTNPNGQVIAERSNNYSKPGAPQWFINLLAFNIQPGYAQVHDGWSQFGQLRLESDTYFAYEALWNGGQRLLLMSLIVGLMSGIIASFVLRSILHPLKAVVNQAEAIGKRRFITIKEPWAPEFKVLVKAMNRLSNSVKRMLLDESRRLENLRIETNHDQTSGLLNRSRFISLINNYTSVDEKTSGGVLAIARLANLAEINQELGRKQTDALIKRLGLALESLCKDNQHLTAGRVTGADFAVFSHGKTDGDSLANQIKDLLYKAIAQVEISTESLPDFSLSVAVISFKESGNIEEFVNTLDHVLCGGSPSNTDQIHVVGNI